MGGRASATTTTARRPATRTRLSRIQWETKGGPACGIAGPLTAPGSLRPMAEAAQELPAQGCLHERFGRAALAPTPWGVVQLPCGCLAGHCRKPASEWPRPESSAPLPTFSPGLITPSVPCSGASPGPSAHPLEGAPITPMVDASPRTRRARLTMRPTLLHSVGPTRRSRRHRRLQRRLERALMSPSTRRRQRRRRRRRRPRRRSRRSSSAALRRPP